MIVLTAAADRPRDPRSQAGYEAERTMAFYLRREFGDAKDVFVYNDLRLVLNGDVAQIDHLVLHRAGMVIVESKSVCGVVTVNERGEWTRRSGRHTDGIPSPALQAERQRKLLQLLLRENERRILNRMLFGTLQPRFNKYWPIDIFVAIADRGRITRKIEVPELLKADQVPGAIMEIIERHRRGRRSLNPLNGDGDRTLAKDEHGRLVEFLRHSNTPRRPSPPSANGAGAPAVPGPPSPPQTGSDSPPEAAPDPDPPKGARPKALVADLPLTADCAEPPPPCRKCGSHDVRMVYARTSRPYYLRCQECDGSTPISWTCAGCGQPARVRKRGQDFFRVCEEGCGQVVHIFRNPE
jgi:hypothetical protein